MRTRPHRVTAGRNTPDRLTAASTGVSPPLRMAGSTGGGAILATGRLGRVAGAYVQVPVPGSVDAAGATAGVARPVFVGVFAQLAARPVPSPFGLHPCCPAPTTVRTLAPIATNGLIVRPIGAGE